MQWAIVGFRRKLGQLFEWQGWPTVVAAATAAAAIGALIFSAKSVQATSEQNNLAEQGQISERFTKAVEQLGSGDQALELGGVYALEQLARDSSRDHQSVFEVLATFVRDGSPVGPGCGQGGQVGASVGAGVLTPPVTQGTLTAIKRRNADNDGDLIVQLDGVCIHGADLRDAHFGGAELRNVDLRDAQLVGADLTDTYLTGANLSGANLYGRGELNSADVSGADLSDADLRDADLRDVTVGCTDQTDSNGDIRCTKLIRADLRGAKLTGVDLSDADMTGIVADARTEWPEGYVPPSNK